MAFNQAHFYLSTTGYPADVAQRIFSYKSSDEIDDIKADGYFNAAVPALHENDLIYVGSSDDVELLYVAAVDPITTADLVVESQFELQPNSIETEMVVNEAVTTEKLADGSITNAKLGDNSVAGDKIAQLGIQHGSYALQSIDSGDLADGACDTTQIADDAISTSKLQSDSVTTRTIAANACEEDQIADDAISNDKLRGNSVDRRVIADHAVGNDQLDQNMWRIKDMIQAWGNGNNPLLVSAPVRTTDRATATSFGSSPSNCIVNGVACYTGGVSVYFANDHVATSQDNITVTTYTRGLYNEDE